MGGGPGMIRNNRRWKQSALVGGAMLWLAAPAFAQTVPTKGLLDEAAAAISAGRYVEALATYGRAIAAGPSDAAVYAKRGQLFDQLGQPGLAARDYRVAVKLNPEDAGLQTSLCLDLALTNHDLDGALAACKAAVSLAPQSASALSARGYLHLRRGSYAEAAKDYSTALELSPAAPSEMFGLGVAWTHTGKVKEGRGEIASATLDSADVVSDWKARGFGLQGEIVPGKPVTKASQAALSVKDRKVFLDRDERYTPVGDCGVVTTGGDAAPVTSWSGDCRFGLIHGVGKLVNGTDARFVYGRQLTGAEAGKREEQLKLAYQPAEDALTP
ncbi:MAG: tetratricopeptide repeat protein [Burkholderiales bacterium]|nr:MAG: tetratricopeptide repeat protein [Burkholderiales bacterium]